MNNETYKESLKYLKKGWSVIPLRPKDKIPLIEWKEFQKRLPTEEELKTWFNGTDNNIALVTGEISGRIVVVDVEKGADLSSFKITPTFFTATGGGGYHHYYRVPTHKKIPGNSTRVNTEKVDIRGEGGYAVLPPSIHPNGIAYKWDFENINYGDKFADLPDWVYNISATKEKVEFSEGQITEGQRNDVLTSICGTFLKKHPVEEWPSVKRLLRVTNLERCNPPLPERDIDTIFQSISEAEYASLKNKPPTIITPALEDRKKEILTLNEILKMEELDEPFILEKMIVEGSINAITAESGVGKSLVVLKMAEAIARGEPFLGEYKTKRKKVLILDLEMSQNDIIQRCKSIIQTNVEGLDFYCGQDFNIEDENDFNWLCQEIKDKNYGLIIFDAFSAIHQRNENDNSEINFINIQFLKLTHELPVSIIFVHHHRKAMRGQVSGMDSARGASQILQKTASQLILEASMVSENRIHLTLEQGKARQNKRLQRFGFDVSYNEIENKTDFIFTGEEALKISVIEAAKNKILNEFELGRKYLLKEIIRDFDMTDSTARTAIKELTTAGLIDNQKLGKGEEMLFDNEKVGGQSKLYFLAPKV